MISFSIYITLVVACLVACVTNRQHIKSTYVYFLLLFLSVLLFELLGIFVSERTANILNHLYQPIEFTLISLIYKTILRTRTVKNSIIYFIVLFLIVSFFTSVLVEGIDQPNTISFLIGSVFIILYALLYVYELYARPPQYENLFVNPYFWFNTGNLFFYTGTFFQMGLDAYLMQVNPEIAQEMRIIIKLLNYTLYVLYLIGLTCRRIFPLSS